jgi:hypothetical protein
MSLASERKSFRETLAAWSLLTTAEVAKVLHVSTDTARRLDLPWIKVGSQYRLDPIDLAVHMLAEKRGATAEALWEEHGDETPRHARSYIRQIRAALD